MFVFDSVLFGVMRERLDEEGSEKWGKFQFRELNRGNGEVVETEIGVEMEILLYINISYYNYLLLLLLLLLMIVIH